MGCFGRHAYLGFPLFLEITVMAFIVFGISPRGRGIHHRALLTIFIGGLIMEEIVDFKDKQRHLPAS